MKAAFRHMRGARSLMAVAAVVGLAVSVSAWTTTEVTRGGAVIIVKMVDVSTTEFKFDPAEISVQPGDTVRFVQAGAMPHNVDFRVMPEGTDLGDAKMGPFLTTPDETYDVVIDGRFAAGEHGFVCTPHEFMGMTGTLTVEGS